jgi:hypothetical protein
MAGRLLGRDRSRRKRGTVPAESVCSILAPFTARQSADPRHTCRAFRTRLRPCRLDRMSEVIAFCVVTRTVFREPVSSGRRDAITRGVVYLPTGVRRGHTREDASWHRPP